MRSWAASLVFLALLRQNKALAQDVFQCPLCGEDRELTNADGVVTVPQNGDFPCATLITLSEQGGIDAATCTVLQPFVQNPCGCRDAVSPNGTATPTESPTMAPTFGVPPACFTDINNILQRESALTQQEIQTGRTYILCPDNVYFMGRLNQNNGFDDGFDAIVPRPNVHFKCGESGSSSNNCRLLDGTFPIISVGGDPEHTNVTFQGLTIESSANGGLVAARPGDLNFVDCIFKVSTLLLRSMDSFVGGTSVSKNTCCRITRILVQFIFCSIAHWSVDCCAMVGNRMKLACLSLSNPTMMR